MWTEAFCVGAMCAGITTCLAAYIQAKLNGWE